MCEKGERGKGPRLGRALALGWEGQREEASRAERLTGGVALTVPKKLKATAPTRGLLALARSILYATWHMHGGSTMRHEPFFRHGIARLGKLWSVLHSPMYHLTEKSQLRQDCRMHTGGWAKGTL